MCGQAIRLWLLTTLCCVLSQMGWAVADAQDPSVSFSSDVLPILRQHCYECHDGDKQTSGYRVDVRRQAIAGGESGSVGILPGDPEQSELLLRVISDDDDQRMPPAGPLASSEIDILRRWIEQGAEWPAELANEEQNPADHWVFQPPSRPAIPRVSDPAWCRNPIDRFVLKNLEANQLSPSPTADKITLCRRLYLDLTGLPPTPEQVDAFVLSDAPDAYLRLVDQLLASPQFGVRHALPWLDAARYADSDGYEKDKQRPMWFYRDWVINAFNADLPYDVFIKHQIAGDLIEGADQTSRVATGFVRGSMINEEGGADPEQFRMEGMFDRMDTLGKAVLGLTISCAQCHNHKFDPISQEEYFQLMAFLNSDHDANLPVYTAEQRQQRGAILSEIEGIEQELRAVKPDWKELASQWATSQLSDASTWTVVPADWDENASGGQKFLDLGDGSLLAQGYAPTKSSPTFTLRLGPEALPLSGLRLELLTHPNLPHLGPGRSIFGTAALSEIRVRATPLGENAGEPYDIRWQTATANVEPTAAPLPAVYDDRGKQQRVTGPVAMAIDGDPSTAWGTDIGPGRRNRDSQAVFVPSEPIVGGPDGVELLITLTQNHGGWNSDDNQSHNLGRIRFAVTGVDAPQADPFDSPLREAISVPASLRSETQWNLLFSAWRQTVEAWAPANAEIEQLWNQHPEPESQLVLVARQQPRETFILKRGDFLSPTRSVQPGVPAVLNPLPETGDTGGPRDRLALAEWLVADDAPTTSRAIVNRLWQTYFGLGLVETPEDLGLQSPPPSHPELLDYLAVELQESDWSRKHLHRLIVTSSTYRQQALLDAELQERDPVARLLSHRSRQRLPAEMIRDVALSASGLLNPQIGGPPCYPPLPDWMLKPPVSYGPKNWYESQGGDRYRRGLYIHRYRSLPYPSLQVFDAPNGDASCVRRSLSNTPLQALTTLNDPTFNEAARALGCRLIEELPEGSDQARLERAMRLCVSRLPDAEELGILSDLLVAQRERLASGSLSAEEILAERTVQFDSSDARRNAALWTLVARVILNLDEVITRP
ncbi:PSD1 and planctomycete cytochrome C domain-containing protein [Planctomycetaceae bacterium SH139]